MTCCNFVPLAKKYAESAKASSREIASRFEGNSCFTMCLYNIQHMLPFAPTVIIMGYVKCMVIYFYVVVNIVFDTRNDNL